MPIKALDDRGIKYQIKTSKQSKSVSLRMGFDTILHIRKPSNLSLTALEKIIESKMAWIEKNFLLNYQPKRQFVNGEIYLVLGQKYHVFLHRGSTNDVKIIDNQLVITLDGHFNGSIKNLVDEYIINLATFVLNESLNRCFIKMKDELKVFPKLIIKSYKSQWGCCYFKKQVICLNYRLVHLPIELIEYVIFHELTHLIVPNHSPLFHQVLQKYCPNERKLKKSMRLYNPIYE